MKPDPNYPRMMFHRTLDPVTVYSRDEELLLGGEWSRTTGGSPPREEKPPVTPFDPEPEEDEPLLFVPAEPEEEREEEHSRKAVRSEPVPPVKSRGRSPAAHGPPHKKSAHKRKA